MVFACYVPFTNFFCTVVSRGVGFWCINAFDYSVKLSFHETVSIFLEIYFSYHIAKYEVIEPSINHTANSRKIEKLFHYKSAEIFIITIFFY